MTIRIKNCAVEMHFLFAAAVTLMLILDTSGAAAIGLASCIAHECGHLALLLAFKESPRRVYLGAFGMRIERAGAGLSLLQECGVSLAGAAINFALAFFFALLQTPEVPAFRNAMLTNLGIAFFNLLPVESLDGGRALFHFLCAVGASEERARAFCAKLSVYVLIPLICLGVALLVHSGFNFTLLAVGCYLFLLLGFKGAERW
ncbi:MAG: hypothetical protein FWG82_04665 [Oscillospiraceae bacterium]|nr:hypothetical protein [Oscillospiraceae bacterium]